MSEVSFCIGLRGKNFRTVGEALSSKNQNKQKSKPPTLHTAYLCSRWPEPRLCLFPRAIPALAPQQECAEKQLCLPPPLSGLRSGWSQGCVKVSYSFTLSCLEQSKSKPCVFPLPDILNLLSKPSQTGIFP